MARQAVRRIADLIDLLVIFYRRKDVVCRLWSRPQLSPRDRVCWLSRQGFDQFWHGTLQNWTKRKVEKHIGALSSTLQSVGNLMRDLWLYLGVETLTIGHDEKI